MCHVADRAAASTPGTSITPSPTATIALARFVGRTVLHVQQPARSPSSVTIAAGSDPPTCAQ